MLSKDIVAASSSKTLATPSTKTARSIPSTAAAIGESNTQAYGSNARSNTQQPLNDPDHKRRELWGAGQDQSVDEIYSSFISAVSCSLSHSLGKEQGWIQVGPYTCVDERTLGDGLFDKAGLHSWMATTTELSFDVKWLPSGTLLISFFQARLPRHTRVSAMLPKNEHSTELAVGSPLLLSPFGIRSHYLGVEDLPKSDVQRRSTAQVKALILSRLAHQGSRDLQDATWIQVQMGRKSYVSVGPPVSLWPADLCLCKDALASVSGEDVHSLNRSIADGSIDPLEEAEAWFLGKAARMEVLQARVREENQGGQVMKGVGDTDDEDILSPVEIQMDQGITPQDVSGIYPTPPDGLPPALLGSLNPNNLQYGDYEDEEKELHPSDEALGDYDGQRNDDLFGDMDIDMFASNGLTEADFSFFDEPGMIDEDSQETSPVMTLDDVNEITDHPMAFEEQGLKKTPHERHDSKSDRDVVEGQEDVIGEQGMARYYQTTSLPAHMRRF